MGMRFLSNNFDIVPKEQGERNFGNYPKGSCGEPEGLPADPQSQSA